MDHRDAPPIFWCAGVSCPPFRTNFSADTLKTTTPLLNKVILTWLVNAYIYHRLSDEEKVSGIIPKPKGIGYGIGLAFGLFAMQGKYFVTEYFLIKALTRFSCRGCQSGVYAFIFLAVHPTRYLDDKSFYPK